MDDLATIHPLRMTYADAVSLLSWRTYAPVLRDGDALLEGAIRCAAAAANQHCASDSRAALEAWLRHAYHTHGLVGWRDDRLTSMALADAWLLESLPPDSLAVLRAVEQHERWVMAVLRRIGAGRGAHGPALA